MSPIELVSSLEVTFLANQFVIDIDMSNLIVLVRLLVDLITGVHDGRLSTGGSHIGVGLYTK